MSLTVYDFRDMDLMLHLRESPATAKQLAETLGLDDDGVRNVAIRVAWMRRFGMLDLDEKSRLWSLSDGGSRVVAAKHKAATMRKVESIPDEEMVEVMAHVTSRYMHGDAMTAALLRREFQYGTSPKRR